MYCVNAPPTSGPAASPIWQPPSIIPINAGRFSIGADAAIIVMAPFCSPELPMPATARPTMNIKDEVAMPQTSDPSKKTSKKDRKVHCRVSQLSRPLALYQQVITFDLK